MSLDPPPPRMSLDDYADWIYANLTHAKNREQQILQKQIQEPPLSEPFRYIDAPASPKVAQSIPAWTNSSRPREGR